MNWVQIAKLVFAAVGAMVFFFTLPAFALVPDPVVVQNPVGDSLRQCPHFRNSEVERDPVSNSQRGIRIRR